MRKTVRSYDDDYFIRGPNQIFLLHFIIEEFRSLTSEFLASEQIIYLRIQRERQ